ncbi:helix-turn-helix domain-containing protein [Aquibium sp. ELW1220]|uniref:winged helix-turn-helix transcriptional regulator n=1 Tax=Aquibium sp. ELW1220 TaxID=2976766 RepID=UPI0025B1758B|nr:helix-turn-helix domain-containing protein [Aquibium sp. ELW1220]MDN2580066.1 helix-turn-helix transcriptional regulator [Aquibium sp. ELW1220]
MSERGLDVSRQEPDLSAAGQAKIKALAAALRVEPAGLPGFEAGARLADLARRMDQHDHDRDAPVREVMARLGDRWSTLILLVLSAGTFRHAELRRLIAALSAEKAISQRMMTLRLRALERDGMVERTVTPTVPPRVDYALTPMGREFVGLVHGMLRWLEAHDARILASRTKFEAEMR